VIYFIDDTTYLKNNRTIKEKRWDPVLNFTYMLDGNFSDSIINCF